MFFCFSLVGCGDNQQNISKEEKNQLIYGDLPKPSDNDFINGEYQKVSNLKADGVDTSILFKFNGILFGKSFLAIDCEISGEPIGEISKLIDETLVPKIDGETNVQELVGALIYECDENSAVICYNNVYYLFEKIA